MVTPSFLPRLLSLYYLSCMEAAAQLDSLPPTLPCIILPKEEDDVAISSSECLENHKNPRKYKFPNRNYNTTPSILKYRIYPCFSQIPQYKAAPPRQPFKRMQALKFSSFPYICMQAFKTNLLDSRLHACNIC